MIPLLLLLLQAGSFTEYTYTSDHGSRQYWLYVPSSYDAQKPLPLVVMLHGCTQDAADIARGTRLNERAEAEGFIVAYPQQPAGMNPLKCWNWYDAKHQARDAGEPALVAGITQAVLQSHKIDPGRVFLAGLSAGAAMANIVAVNYPELFAAVALHSGIEFKAATQLLDARAAMSNGGPDPAEQGKLAFAAMGERARAIPVLIVQGKRDQAVPPLHAAQLTQQWWTVHALAGANALPATTSIEVIGEYNVSRTVVSDAKRVLIETIVIDELSHAWSGGAAEGTFTDPKAPDATKEMLRFFGLTSPSPSPTK